MLEHRPTIRRHALVARAIRGYEEGVLNAQAIATLQGCTEAETLAELEEAGIFPRSLEIEFIEVEDVASMQ